VNDDITAFRIDIPEADLDDLRERLRRTRWPEAATVDDWSLGIPLDYTRELCQYWLEGYDWRACETRLNGFPQFRTDVDGLTSTSCTSRPPAKTRCRWSSRTAGPARSSSSARSPGRRSSTRCAPRSARSVSPFAGSATRFSAFPGRDRSNSETVRSAQRD
jgi:hypothetical protein